MLTALLRGAFDSMLHVPYTQVPTCDHFTGCVEGHILASKLGLMMPPAASRI